MSFNTIYTKIKLPEIYKSNFLTIYVVDRYYNIIINSNHCFISSIQAYVY